MPTSHRTPAPEGGPPFRDRIDAGEQLAQALDLDPDDQVVVVGLPRGGVPVAAVVASVLGAPLDVVLVRKLGLPGQPELAMGAIGEGAVRVLHPDVVDAAGVSDRSIAAVEARERRELERRVERYRGQRPAVALDGRTVIIVDDGLATGSTARAAAAVARARGASRIILAVPVAPPGWTERMGDVADEFVSAATPAGFLGVGQFYRDFRPTTDDEVVELLRRQHPTEDR